MIWRRRHAPQVRRAPSSAIAEEIIDIWPDRSRLALASAAVPKLGWERSALCIDTVACVAERTVNARQLEVLKWIVAGCPEGVMKDTTYKTTAIALQNRRLATVIKKRGVWTAEATEAGRHFAEQGRYPAGHWTKTSDTTRANIVAGETDHPGARRAESHRLAPG